jgi:ABC-type glycerol-3-phosphate transport system substrate-binding protein
MSELVTVGAIVPLDESLVPRADYFPGIWDTNVVDGTLYGIPWYVDTRVLFYRTDMIPTPPRTWSEWIEIMTRLKAASKDPDFYPLVMPTNEWPQPVIMALNRGARLVDERGHALFDEPVFIEGFTFYVDLFRRGLVPTVSTRRSRTSTSSSATASSRCSSADRGTSAIRTRLTKSNRRRGPPRRSRADGAQYRLARGRLESRDYQALDAAGRREEAHCASRVPRSRRNFSS